MKIIQISGLGLIFSMLACAPHGGRQAIRYEYNIVWVGSSKDPVRGATFNKMGQEGWELKAVDSDDMATFCRVAK